MVICPCLTLFAQKIVHYEIDLRDTIIQVAGKNVHAISGNNQFPLPDLYFEEGDTAEIVIHNNLKEPTSLHWHGLFVPNTEDGVPFLTQQPIPIQSKYIYRFPIKQNGTHWYHSHFGFQEQIGMYGSLVLKKKSDDPTFRRGIDDIPQLPLILSDWSNIKPERIDRLLHNANDYFAIKKNSTQSYAEAITSGHLFTKIINEWKRMNAMDVSDVFYDQFLVNGKPSVDFSQFKAGDKVRLRIANAGASSYFWITYAGGKIMVVASDGNDVEPIEVDRLIIGVSETYDIIVTIPSSTAAYELLFTSEDRQGSAAAYFGAGPKQLAMPLPPLQYFEGMKMMNDMMRMDGNLVNKGMPMQNQKMDMNRVMYPELKTSAKEKQTSHEHNHKVHEMTSRIKTLSYDSLRAPKNTELPSNAKIKYLKFELTGNMDRYVWSMDNKILKETDKILIQKDEIVSIVIFNNSMMRHPMHLHGHDFRILNSQKSHSPLKNVLDIMPMESDTIEFLANAEGDWFFHCHILYHMMAGMNRVFSYADSPSNVNITNPKKFYKKLQNESDPVRFMFKNDLATNGMDGEMAFQNTRWALGTDWRIGQDISSGYESETHLGRYIGKMQWFMPFIGFDWRSREDGKNYKETNLFGQYNTKDNRTYVSIGFNYTLPMLINFRTELYSQGYVRLQLSREDIPLSKRIRGEFMWNTDMEYMFGLSYILTKNFGIRTHYDSDMGWGLGIQVRY